MAVDVFNPQGCFGTNFPRLSIGNTYAILLPVHPHSVSPESALHDLGYPYLVAGDFNIHNAASDPSRLLSTKEEKESAPYFDRATDLGFSHLNTPGIYTRFPLTGTHRPSAIDLAFANPDMCPAFRSWDAASLPSTGSDHAPILISICPPSAYNDKPRPRWQEANWPGLTDRLKNWLIPPPPATPSPNQLDQWFSSALSGLTSAIEDNTPAHAPPQSLRLGGPHSSPLSENNSQKLPTNLRNSEPVILTLWQDSTSWAISRPSRVPKPSTGPTPWRNLHEQHLDGQTVGRPRKNTQISLDP